MTSGEPSLGIGLEATVCEGTSVNLHLVCAPRAARRLGRVHYTAAER